MKGVSVIALALAVAACDHQHAAGMALSVQKQTAKGCFATISSKPADPVLGLDSCDPPPDTNVVAGVDRLRFVIDYGDGVTVSPGTQLPNPAVTVTFDGNASTAPVRFEPVHRAGDRIYFAALFDAPAVLADQMQVSVEAAPDLRDQASGLGVELPVPVLSVENCADQPACTIPGGASTATIRIDIPSRTGQTVALSSRLDGVARNDGQMVTTAVGQAGQTTKTATLTIPFVDRQSSLDIDAVWLGRTATAHAVLQAPAIDVAVKGCATGCEQTAGVGSVRAIVSIAGDVAQSATLRSLVNQAVVSELSITTVALSDHQTQLEVPVPVPFAPDQTSWQLELAWRSFTKSTLPITLQAPTPTSAIAGCAAACTVKAGTSVELDISAPSGIQTSSAAFSTLTDATAPVAGVITEFTIDQLHALKKWQTTLPVPTTGTTWTIQSSVAGYPATTIVAEIVP